MSDFQLGKSCEKLAHEAITDCFFGGDESDFP